MKSLCSIYARDVISFLNFPQLQECRLVSHSVNATIVNHPVSIPARRHLSELSALVGSAERYNWPPQIGEDGYVETLAGGYDERRSWKRIQAEWGCCREELEESAQALVGESIFPSHPANSIVDICITPEATDGVLLWSRNEMTAETAFGILHLLEHLRHVYIVTHYSDCAGSINPPTLNPSIIRFLKGGDGRGAYKLHVGLYSSSHVPTTIDELMAELAHLKAGVLPCFGENLATALDFALHGKPHCRRIVLGCQPNSAFNAVLLHFRATVTRIGQNAVSELVLSRYTRNNPDFWPVDLPPLKEMEMIGNRFYRLPGGMINVHSGERFNVVVQIERLKRRGPRRLAEMRLHFP